MLKRGLFAFSVFLFSVNALAAMSTPRETPVVVAVRKAGPAVVNISTEIVSRSASPFSGDPFFDRFFGDFFADIPGRARKTTSLGSGVVIDEAGHILTNEHVIRNANRIVVTLADGGTFEARLVGADAHTDLAVLAVDAQKALPHIEMGRSNDLMIGETVIAIGNPFGLTHTVTTGVLSAVNRTIRGSEGRTYSDFLQIDASINPGNSGGPLLNIEGTLIGINSAIYRSAEGIGFAIPIDKARRIVSDLLDYGEVHRAWLGVQVQEVDKDLAQYFELEKPEGVLVRRVFDNGPAKREGIRRGDLLVALDGVRIRSRSDYLDRLAGYTADSEIEVTVLAGSGERKVTLHAGEPPEGYAHSLARDWLGVEVRQNSKQLARRLKLVTAGGMVIEGVTRGGPAFDAGIEERDVIRTINDETVDTEADFLRAVLAASHRETVVLAVQRGRVVYHISMNP